MFLEREFSKTFFSPGKDAMGKRGPKRRSPELSAKLGNPGHVALPKNAAASVDDSRNVPAADAASTCPAAPAWLSDSGREIWRVVAGDLSARLVLKPSDLPALARYCDAFAMWHVIRRDIYGRSAKTPRMTYTVSSKHGTRQAKRPEVDILRQLDADLRAYENLYGLAPASRVSLLSNLAEMRDDSKPPMYGRVLDRSLPPGMPPRPANPLDALDALGGAPPKPPTPIGLLAASSSRKTHETRIGAAALLWQYYDAAMPIGAGL
jgi:P27 family predicted phage terminase small subunit